MIVRAASVDDVEEIWELRYKLAKETDFMLPTKEEANLNKEKQIEAFRSQINTDENLFLVAETDKELSGFLFCKGNLSSKTRHVVSLVIGLLQDAWGTGAADKLFEQMFNWARDHNIERIELTVMSLNTRATKFYENHGFKIEGTRRNAIRLADKFADELYMARLSPFSNP